ncbi:plasmid mobilization relaxosome protein MobC [Sphingobacterium daejeonense]|uniref:Plasmid mobilization relaxosome protein MobC n=1 Tax=Sphingobacterium daejeonense TaxID=371142 RepID=A0ABW3RJE7_9SPHI
MRIKIMKDKHISLRLDEIEYKRIIKFADLANMSVSSYLRTAALSKEVKPRFSSVEKAYFQNLSAIGNNINQLTKYYNAKNGAVDNLTHQKLINTLDHLDNLVSKLLNYGS